MLSNYIEKDPCVAESFFDESLSSHGGFHTFTSLSLLLPLGLPERGLGLASLSVCVSSLLMYMFTHS